MTYPVWLSEEAAEERKELSESQDRKLLWWRDRLEEDVTTGDPIRKSLIPDPLKKKFGIDNLWRMELPEGWRALYTIASRPAEGTVVIILRIYPTGTTIGCSGIPRPNRRTETNPPHNQKFGIFLFVHFLGRSVVGGFSVLHTCAKLRGLVFSEDCFKFRQ